MIFLLLVPLLLMVLAYIAISKVLQRSIATDRRNSQRYPKSKTKQSSSLLPPKTFRWNSFEGCNQRSDVVEPSRTEISSSKKISVDPEENLRFSPGRFSDAMDEDHSKYSTSLEIEMKICKAEKNQVSFKDYPLLYRGHKKFYKGEFQDDAKLKIKSIDETDLHPKENLKFQPQNDKEAG